MQFLRLTLAPLDLAAHGTAQDSLSLLHGNPPSQAALRVGRWPIWLSFSRTTLSLTIGTSTFFS